jgi:hypothetical protein
VNLVFYPTHFVGKVHRMSDNSRVLRLNFAQSHQIQKTLPAALKTGSTLSTTGFMGKAQM